MRSTAAEEAAAGYRELAAAAPEAFRPDLATSLNNLSTFLAEVGRREAALAAVEEAVPADVLSAALYARFRSRQTHTFAEKMLSAMRAKFGGHGQRPT